MFHRTLKSGSRIKDRQLGRAERLPACLGVALVVAWRIDHLSLLGREVSPHPGTAFFEEVEGKPLDGSHHNTPIAAAAPPSRAEAIRMLGAWGDALDDGPPPRSVGAACSGSTLQCTGTPCAANPPPPIAGALTPAGDSPPLNAPGAGTDSWGVKTRPCGGIFTHARAEWMEGLLSA